MSNNMCNVRKHFNNTLLVFRDREYPGELLFNPLPGDIVMYRYLPPDIDVARIGIVLEKIGNNQVRILWGESQKELIGDL